MSASAKDPARHASSTAQVRHAPGRVVAAYPPVAVDSLPIHLPDLSSPLAGPSRVTKGSIQRGESLGRSLSRKGVPASVVHQIASEMRPVFDFRHSQPGDRYRLLQGVEGELLDFRYATGPEDSFHLFRVGDRFEARREKAELEPRVARIAGLVQTSLYDAVRSLGESPQLAGDFADLFVWDIDFSRGVKSGDDFAVLYERLYTRDEDGVETYVRPGRILAARYRGTSGEHLAVYYEDEGGKGGYYRTDGSPLEREFLAAPLEFSRITSRFTSARRHPILKITRPHHGIDYAAPVGTPVWAVSEGEVVYRGWGGGFGNLIKIRHSNGYISYYSHLSRFHKNLRVGQKVRQKQVIGYVGKTGLATGPHVCFRVARDGHYVDPMRVKSPPGPSLRDSERDEFQLVRDSLLADLEGHALAATEEAL